MGHDSSSNEGETFGIYLLHEWHSRETSREGYVAGGDKGTVAVHGRHFSPAYNTMFCGIGLPVQLG
eukprot:1562315-Ditylum_brightwellii.AAC.1